VTRGAAPLQAVLNHTLVIDEDENGTTLLVQRDGTLVLLDIDEEGHLYVWSPEVTE